PLIARMVEQEPTQDPNLLREALEELSRDTLNPQKAERHLQRFERFSPELQDAIEAVHYRHLVLRVLGVAGESLKRFDKLPTNRQDATLSVPDEEGKGTSERAMRARKAAEFLRARRDGRSSDLGLGSTLTLCAANQDPFLRKNAAVAYCFWDADNAETTLLTLLKDDGHGAGEATRELNEAQIYAQAIQAL